MGLEELIKAGYLSPPEYEFNPGIINEAMMIALLLKKRVRIASLVDSKVYDLSLESENNVKIIPLAVHTKQTATMAGYTEDEFIKILGCDFAEDYSFLKKIELVEPKNNKPWWKFW